MQINETRILRCYEIFGKRQRGLFDLFRIKEYGSDLIAPKYTIPYLLLPLQLFQDGDSPLRHMFHDRFVGIHTVVAFHPIHTIQHICNRSAML